MAEKKKKGRRAYLDSFQRNAKGEYEYKGETYVWQMTEQERRKELFRLWILCIGMLAGLIAAGSVEAPGTLNCIYVLLPYVINLIAGISVFWGMCRLTAGGYALRAYVYQKSAAQIPGRALFTFICAALAVLGEIVFVLQNGMERKAVGFVLFVLAECTVSATVFLLGRHIRNMRWEKQDLIDK